MDANVSLEQPPHGYDAALYQPTVVTIKAATVRQGDIGIHVDALGTVTPISTVSLYSQVTGRGRRRQLSRGANGSQRPIADRNRSPAYEAQLKQAQGTLEHDQGLLIAG